MSLSVAAPVFARRLRSAAFSAASRAASASLRALDAAAASLRPAPTVPSASTSSVMSLSVAAFVFLSLSRIALFCAAMRAASSSFFFLFASASSFRFCCIVSSSCFESPPPLAASFAFNSAFSLRRCSASSAFLIADSNARCLRAACVLLSRSSAVRAPGAIPLLNGFLGFPAASSLAALYTFLNSSKVRTPLSSVSNSLNMRAANSTVLVFSFASSPRSSSSAISSAISIVSLLSVSYFWKTERTSASLSFAAAISALRLCAGMGVPFIVTGMVGGIAGRPGAQMGAAARPEPSCVSAQKVDPQLEFGCP